ncbi:MAG: DUF1318 domain-containing protein [Methylacidiphilales bacterium]|nr:DUF1318 domain-containing protein [Candidatus Methylacidiphilales bacterium]
MKTTALRPLLYTGFSIAVLIPVACTPAVRLTTTDPVKIDVNMRADIYTHGDKDQKDSNPANSTSLSPKERRFNRRGEVQALKNGRIIGESNVGQLVIREKPADAEYAAYVQRVVQEENTDRQSEFKEKSNELKKPLDVYIKEFAANTRSASFPGEWVQEEDGTWHRR